jgi:hypothetical protein
MGLWFLSSFITWHMQSFQSTVASSVPLVLSYVAKKCTPYAIDYKLRNLNFQSSYPIFRTSAYMHLHTKAKYCVWRAGWLWEHHHNLTNKEAIDVTGSAWLKVKYLDFLILHFPPYLVIWCQCSTTVSYTIFLPYSTRYMDTNKNIFKSTLK